MYQRITPAPCVPGLMAQPLGRKIQDVGRLSTTPKRSSVVTTNAVVIPDAYGYVLGSIATTALIERWMSVRVGLARREFGVSYPAMMAEGTDENAVKFNCIQRAHQNTLETLPLAVACQLLMGLAFPITAAALGVAWAIGRIIYANGYSSGDPKKRIPGSAVAGIFYLCLIIGCFYAGYSMVVVS
jgi:glutathione S-transferase